MKPLVVIVAVVIIFLPVIVLALRTSGRGKLPDPYAVDTVEDLIRKGLKLNAIRLYHEKTGAGLKESKDAVDTYEQTGSWPPGQSPDQVQ